MIYFKKKIGVLGPSTLMCDSATAEARDYCDLVQF